MVSLLLNAIFLANTFITFCTTLLFCKQVANIKIPDYFKTEALAILKTQTHISFCPHLNFKFYLFNVKHIITRTRSRQPNRQVLLPRKTSQQNITVPGTRRFDLPTDTSPDSFPRLLLSLIPPPPHPPPPPATTRPPPLSERCFEANLSSLGPCLRLGHCSEPFRFLGAVPLLGGGGGGVSVPVMGAGGRCPDRCRKTRGPWWMQGRFGLEGGRWWRFEERSTCAFESGRNFSKPTATYSSTGLVKIDSKLVT